MAISSFYDITSPLTPLLILVTSSTNNISSQLRSWCCGEVWYEKEGDTQAPTSWCADFLRASCWQDSLPCWLSWDYFHSALPFCKCIILLGKSHPLIETINCPFIDLPHNCLVKLLFTLPQGKSHGVMNQVKSRFLVIPGPWIPVSGCYIITSSFQDIEDQLFCWHSFFIDQYLGTIPSPL